MPLSDSALAAEGSFVDASPAETIVDPSPSSNPDSHDTTTGHNDGATPAERAGKRRSEKKHPLDDGRFGAPGTSIYDYRRLNMRSTEVGMWTGVLTGGAATWGLRRWSPVQVPKNGLFLTFILTATSVSYYTSRRMLYRGMAELNARYTPPPSPEERFTLIDTTAFADEDVHPEQGVPDVRFDTLKEMRDPFFRPGIPRRPA